LSVVVEMDFAKIQNSIRNQLSRFKIAHLLLFSFALHLFVIPFPSSDFVMDEIYWVVSSRLTLQLQPSSVEHPPLARIMGAISMKILGDYWFAWRFPIVLAAIGSLYVFYRIAKRFVNERYALFATALLSFDVVFFVHGSLFYLDMPAIFFGLIGTELYLAKRYYWSAFSFGIAFLMKELGLLFLVAVLIYHIATHLGLGQFGKKADFKKLLAFLVILLLVAGGGLWLYDAIYRPTSNLVSQPVTIAVQQVVDQNGNPIRTIRTILINNSTRGKPITNAIQHALFILNTESGIKNTIPGRGAWSWILPIDNSLLPVHYYYAATDVNGRTITGNGVGWWNINGAVYPPGSVSVDWQVEITPFVEYFLIPIVIAALFNIVRRRDESRIGVLLLSWLTATYVPFLLISILRPQMPTAFSFNWICYSTPALALGIPYVWQTLIRNHPAIREIVMAIQLVSTVIFFLFFFPIPLFR
jgi:4-amino-4-deoxy-L-arabinose transferase-like glycosyltransferase